MDDLIPHPETDVDRRVNDAYRRAVKRGKLQWLWLTLADDAASASLYITDARPNQTAIAVSPDGWAMIVARGADVPWQQEEPP